MNDIFNEITAPLVIILIITGAVIILVQARKISKYKGLIKELSEVFNKDKNLSETALIEKIIHSKEEYVPGPTNEIVNLISNYIKNLFNDSKVFIHITEDKEIAERIITEGFKYSEDFYKSSEELSPTLYDLAYKLQLYKYYGNFVIIMCIPKKLYFTANKAGTKGNRDYLSEYGISEYNPENELSYKLPSRFVKGYVDISNKVIISNELFEINKDIT